MKNLHKNEWAIITLIYIVSTAYFLSYYRYGINLWDEGVPLHGALRLLDGEIPGRDFKAYAPGRYFLFAMSLWVSKGSITGPRILMALMSGWMSCLMYAIGRRFVSVSLALIPVLLFLAFPFFYFYRFLTLSLLIAIWASMNLALKMNLIQAFLSGLSLASILWIREDLGLFCAVVYILGYFLNLAFRGIKHQTGFSLILVLILGSVWLQYNYIGGWDYFRLYINEIVDTFGSQFRGMSLPLPSIVFTRLASDEGLFSFKALLIWSCFILIGLNSITGWIFFRRNFNFLILYSGSIIGAVFLLIRPGFGNCLRIMPLVTILTVVMLETLYQLSNPSIRLLIRFSCTFSVIGMLMFAIAVNPVATQSIGLILHYKQPITIGGLDVVTDSATQTEIKSITDQLLCIPQRESTLLCIPLNPIWNFVLNRENPTKYEWMMPGEYCSFEEIEKVLKNLNSVHIGAILLDNHPVDGYVSRRFSNSHPEVYHWILRHYYSWFRSGEKTIYLRIPNETMDACQNRIEDQIEAGSGITLLESELVDGHPTQYLRMDRESSLLLRIPFRQEEVVRCLIRSDLRNSGSGVRTIIRGMDPVINEGIEKTVEVFDNGKTILEEVMMYHKNWAGPELLLEFKNIGNSIDIVDLQKIEWAPCFN